MRKYIAILLCLVILLSFSACGKIKLAESEAAEQAYEDRIAELEQEIEALQNDSDQPAQTIEPTEAPIETPTPSPEQTPIGMSDTPQNDAQMYSSYAHMVSVDPARGWADFDYFEMMTGAEAVDALVKYEGYDLVDAQVEVNNWEEGGFYEKNTNPQLRTIDLKNVDIRLIIQTDGTLIPNLGNPAQSDFGDVFALYNANPAYLYDYFFYFITVDSNGDVTKVEQIYRP